MISVKNFSIFRFAFGILMIPQVLHLIPHVHDLSNSTFVFHYPGLSFIEAYSHELIDFLGATSIIGAVFLALGILPRIGALVFLVSFGYLFLIDQSFYNNHYYLWVIIAFLFFIVESNKSISIRDLFHNDVNKKFDSNNQLIFCVLITIVYFYGGLAKLTTDWLTGYPMILLAAERKLPSPEFTGLFISYTGLIFDLFIGFLLWWKPKKWYIFTPYFAFHIINYFTFNIGEFPIVMLFAWLLFLDFSEFPLAEKMKTLKALIIKPKIKSVFLSFFLIFQLVFPFRSLAVGNDFSWHRQGYNFSWRMMLNNYKSTNFQYYVKIQNKNIEYYVDFQKLLTFRQYYHAYHEPFMIWQLAQKLKKDGQKKYSSHKVEVYCESVVTLNNREEKQLINPNIDLGRVTYKQLKRNEFINY